MLGVYKRCRQLWTRIFRGNFARHAPQAAHFRLASEGIVFVPLRLRAIEVLEPPAIHLHTGHRGRRLIGGHGLSRRGSTRLRRPRPERHVPPRAPCQSAPWCDAYVREKSPVRQVLSDRARLAKNSSPACPHTRPSLRPSDCSPSPRPGPEFGNAGKKARRQPGQ